MEKHVILRTNSRKARNMIWEILNDYSYDFTYDGIKENAFDINLGSYVNKFNIEEEEDNWNLTFEDGFVLTASPPEKENVVLDISITELQ